jgi:hypothetical protein
LGATVKYLARVKQSGKRENGARMLQKAGSSGINVERSRRTKGETDTFGLDCIRQN